MTSLSNKFKQNTLITKFNEFVRFTGMTEIDQNGFYYCSNLAEIDLPETLQKIGSGNVNGSFYRTALREIDYKNVYWDDHGFVECPNITVVRGKNIKYLNDSYSKCTHIKRLIFPEAAFKNVAQQMGNNMSYGIHDLEMVDLGANMQYIRGHIRYQSNNVYSGTFKNTTVVFRSKSFTFAGKAVLQGCWRCYCTEEMYDYLKNSTYNSYASMVYLIGGAEWTAQFGSSDPYANLTQEEYDYYYKDIVEQG